MRKSVLRSLATASILAFTVGSAQAVTVSYQGSGPFNGNGNAAVTVDSKAGPDRTVSALAGGFHLKGDIFGTGQPDNFVAWCLDIVRVLANNRDYVVTGTPFNENPLSASKIADIGRLFNTAYHGLNLASNAQSAGFQLALWEIVYEKPENAFNLSTGNLTITGDGAARTAGQSFLNNLGNAATRRWNLAFLQSTTGNQNLVTATPVPVPAAAGLLLLALGGLAAVGRRRRMV